MSFGKLGALGRGFGHLGSGGQAGAPRNTLRARAGSFILTGTDMTPKSAYVVPAALGTFALTGIDATLTVPAPSYAGPGDVQSGATVWYGLRAYNAAYATGSNPSVDLVDQAGANTITINILSNGNLDVATIATWVTAHTVTTIKVSKIYDQIGTNFVREPTANVSKMPTLVLSGIGSLPVVHFVLSGPQALTANVSIALSDPYSISTVARRTTGTALGQIMGSNAAPGIFFDGANTLALFDGGGVVDFSAGSVTDNTFWTIQGVLNGASSIGQFATTIVNPVASSPGSTGITFPGINNPSFPSTMDWVEGGIWSGDKHTTFNAVNTNAKAYWGF